ncbi:MAG: hypothetical protein IJT84_05455 [Clostridia bacterium]|nr:hypothetical protein [Clostridia bacterium]
MNYKRISCLVLVLLLCISFCGCGDNNKTVIYRGAYISGVNYDMPESKQITSLGEYTLSIEGEYASPLFGKIGCEKIWGILPIDFLNSWNYEFGSPISQSALFLTYYDPTYEEFFTINSSEAVPNGRILSKEIEDGIRITYYFDKFEISVPVTYKLSEKGLCISVDPLEINENKFIVMSVSVAPFFCSAKNEKSDNRYLFIPSGSGAVMYTDCRGTARTYEEEVYGEDLAREKKWSYTNTEQIHMPIFGAVDGNEAMYGIITSGAQSSSVGAYAGDKNAGYSGVYPIFNIRSYNTVQIDIGGTTGLKNFIRLADKRNTDKFEVNYGILNGEDASVTGIASVYRNYLGLKSGTNNKILNISMLGGLMAKRNAVGVPYSEFSATTTLSDAKTIFEQLSDAISDPMNIRLIGFGKTGLTVEKIAGGFSLNRRLGSKLDLKDFADLCKKNGSKLYFDFETVNFNSSGSGYSKRTDTAVDTTNYRVKKYVFDIALRKVDTTKKSTYLISRKALPKVIADATDTAKDFGISGVSFSSLGNSAYSDFKDINYYGKSGISSDVLTALEKVGKDKISVCTADANDYAAVVSDFIDEMPTVSSAYISLDADVPFYGMVFSGCKENAVLINLSSTPRDKFLDAVKTGSGLSFVLANDVNSDAVISQYSAYISADYSNQKNNIISYVKEYKDCFGAVSGKTVKSYYDLNGVSKTIFENDVVIIVNKTENAVTVDGETVDAKSFVWRAAE